jgi:protein MBA1
VVTNKAVKLPIEKSGLRQAVVRISSRQSLTRYKGDGTPVPRTGTEKEIREYLVIQKMLIKGTEEPWKVWGTTDETTLEAWEEEKAKHLE